MNTLIDFAHFDCVVKAEIDYSMGGDAVEILLKNGKKIVIALGGDYIYVADVDNNHDEEIRLCGIGIDMGAGLADELTMNIYDNAVKPENIRHNSNHIEIYQDID